MLMFQKLLLNFMLIHGYQKHYLMKKISSVSEFKRPFIEYANAKIKLKFDESILRQKLSTSLGLIANYYIVYRLNP